MPTIAILGCRRLQMFVIKQIRGGSQSPRSRREGEDNNPVAKTKNKRPASGTGRACEWKMSELDSSSNLLCESIFTLVLLENLRMCRRSDRWTTMSGIGTATVRQTDGTHCMLFQTSWYARQQSKRGEVIPSMLCQSTTRGEACGTGDMGVCN